MSISKDGKVLLTKKKNGNPVIVGILICAQFFLSIVLSISFAAHIIWPETSRGAAGTPMQISYEGRLTDSSGNALGGTGTPYCFRLSIYDATTAGNKLWPAGTPATTMATTTDGVFSTSIGAADTLSSSVFDFSTTSVSYLQVEVNTTPSTCAGSWEALTPRQQILSSPYALESNNVYGSLLKTDTINNRVQIGTGAGGANPTFFALDVKNVAESVGQSCSTNGLMWYNSATSQALICENNVMQGIGTSGTTTIAGIGTNVAAPIAVGNVIFSNSNGVSFGQNGSTITASVNAGGGATLSNYEPYPMHNTGTAILSAATATSGSASFMPFPVNGYVAAGWLNLVASVSYVTLGTSSGQQSHTFSYGLYSRGLGASSSLLSAITSGSFSDGVTYNNSTITINRATTTATSGYGYATTSSAGLNLSSGYTGLKLVQLPLNSTLAPGMYWLGVYARESTSSVGGGIRLSLYGNALSVTGLAPIGNFSSAYSTGTNIPLGIGGNWNLGAGVFTSAGQTNLPSSLALSALTQNISFQPYMRISTTA